MLTLVGDTSTEGKPEMTKQAVRQKTKCDLSSSAPFSANSYKCVASTKREHFASISTPRKIRNRTGKFRTSCRFVLLASLAVYETMQFRPKRLPLCWLVKCAAALQDNSSDQRNSMVARPGSSGHWALKLGLSFRTRASLSRCSPIGSCPAGASAWAVSSARRRKSRWHRRLTLSSAAILLHSHKRARWRRVPCSVCGCAHVRTMGKI